MKWHTQIQKTLQRIFAECSISRLIVSSIITEYQPCTTATTVAKIQMTVNIFQDAENIRESTVRYGRKVKGRMNDNEKSVQGLHILRQRERDLPIQKSGNHEGRLHHVLG